MKSILTLLLFVSIGCCGQKKDTLNWQDVLNSGVSKLEGYRTDWTTDDFSGNDSFLIKDNSNDINSRYLKFGFNKSHIDTTYGIILYIEMEDSLILGVYDNAPVFAPSFSPILARAMRVEEIETNIERGWTFGKYTIDPETEHPITTTKTSLLIDLQTPKILDPEKWYIFVPYKQFQK